MLQLRDVTVPSSVQTIEIKAVSLWHLLAAGAIGGFAFALGNALFVKSARKLPILR